MIQKLPFKCVHFVGIGGIGMSAIAEMVQALNITVQGSDKAENDNVKRLRQKGIQIFIGHSEDNIKNADAIIYSTATKENIEVTSARQQHIPVGHRSEMLAELLKLKKSICVAGTHGKTTTSSLIASLLVEAGLDPSFIIGGILNAQKSNAQMGLGEWVVAEADESDGSFLRLPSTISVVTNIDPEHLDHYKSFDNEKAAFLTMLNQTSFYGLNILCVDNPTIREILPRIHERNNITYGIDSPADIQAKNIQVTPTGSCFDVVGTLNGKEINLSAVNLNMMGEHNILNALAAIIVATYLGIDENLIKKTLASFQGIQRRLTLRGTANGTPIYDDYAHHPNEIKATLSALKQHINGRLIAVWQPHRWTRFTDLYFEFLNAFTLADRVFVTDVYTAGENPIPGLTPQSFVEKLSSTKPATYVSLDNLVQELKQELQPSDTIVCLGAGSISAKAKTLPQLLGENHEES